MIDLTTIEHHPAIEEIVEVLCAKTQKTDRGFFRTEVAYFLGKMASNMRATISTKDRGDIPVNIYALALATSGFGKGHSISLMEDEFINGFKKRFMEETMPIISEANLHKIADDRALRNASDPAEEFDKLSKEYKRAGAYAFTFDSGTPPAVKQLRHKLLLANCGSINLQIDEIGSNLIGSVDILNLFLELYDQGKVKQKITKNTDQSERAEEMDGKTPTNMLLFGTPAKLFDGGPTEDQFYSFLDTGYARRCLFGMGTHEADAANTQTPAEIYEKLIQPTNAAGIHKWNSHFTRLADPATFGWTMKVHDDVGIELLTYKLECERIANSLADHEEIRKAELSHRYFKVLKLAGAYSFIDELNIVTMENLHRAMKLVEESGTSFQAILNREKTYVKLAKYMAAVKSDLTHADLHEALPFYKSSASQRNEQMTMAIAWGYKNHIIIKKTFVDGIEIFKAEALEETNMDEMVISYSNHYAYDYQNERIPFYMFDQLLNQETEHHWINHWVRNGHRAEENVQTGFNMIALDIDEGTTLAAVHELLKEYKFMTYTTKRHQTEGHGDRFRLIVPINYVLHLDSDEYKEFYTNVLSWLPISVDEQAIQRARKWSTFPGSQIHINNDGEILDALMFIPKTTKNEQFKKDFKAVESLDNLERWFAQSIASGNRNNQMLRYALALVDGGMQLMDVSKQVHAFNKKLNNPLEEDEIDKTILVSVAKRFTRA